MQTPLNIATPPVEVDLEYTVAGSDFDQSGDHVPPDRMTIGSDLDHLESECHGPASTSTASRRTLRCCAIDCKGHGDESKLLKQSRAFIEQTEELECRLDERERRERREVRAFIEKLSDPDAVSMALKAEIERTHQLYNAYSERRRVRADIQLAYYKDLADRRKNRVRLALIHAASFLCAGVAIFYSVVAAIGTTTSCKPWYRKVLK